MTTKQSIKRAGFGISGDVGGLPRKTYYTPDGRIIRAIPSMREYRRKNGGDWEEGTRDANYDKGWLSEMPEKLKPYCSGCDNWHNTEEEIKGCIRVKEAKAKKWEAFARKFKKEDSAAKEEEIVSLKNDVSELKDMVAKLLESKEVQDNR